MEYGFVDKTMLLPTLPLLLISWLLVRRIVKNQHEKMELLGQHFTNATAKTYLPLAVLAFLLLATARPHIGHQEIKIPAVGQDFLILIDVSRSMLANDFHPNRLDFAKRKIEDFVQLIAKKSPGDRIGLIPFSGQAYLFCPLTADYQVLLNYIRTLNPDLISSPGSSLNNAISLAIETITKMKIKNPHLILISDGEDLGYSPEKTKQLLNSLSIRIDTIAIGTTEGQPIPLRDGTFVHNRAGDIVITKLDSKNLSTLAETGDGVFQTASLDDTDWLRIIKASNSTVTEGDQQRTIVNYREIAPIMLAALLMLILIVAFWKPNLLLAVMLITLALINPEQIAAEPAQTKEQANARQGYLAYQQGDYQRALDIFKEHHGKNPSNRQIKEALAHSLFKTKSSEEAAKLYQELANEAENSREAYQAYYNLGNAKLQGQNFDDAISAYQQALEYKPEDKKAKHNLQIAKKMKEQSKNQQRDNQQQQKDNNEQQSQTEQNQTQNKNEKQQPQSGNDKDQETRGQPDPTKKSQDKNTDQKQPANSSKQHPTDQKSKGREEHNSSSNTEHQTKQQNEIARNSNNKYDPSKLAEREARAWLESLPDSPILMNRHSGQINEQQGGQTW